ncbi:MAG: hypothetical protein AAF357_04960, partial [Verrucomicrobiota bacterium]
HLSGQRTLGWWNYHQMIFVRGLVSKNFCTTLFNERRSWGAVTLLDSHLQGEKPHRAAGIINQQQLVMRNVEIVDYRRAVENNDKDRDSGNIEKSAQIPLASSHHNVASLFRSVRDGSIQAAGEIKRLPVKETPTIPWGNPANDWANLLSFGADPKGEEDSSPALQRAIDSGKETIYLPAGTDCRFEGQVEIRGPVQRIIGLEGRFTATGEPVWKVVDGKHPSGLPDAPAVIIERMAHRNGDPAMKIRHESMRTLVVSSCMGFDIEGYGTGDLFIDDLSGHLDRVAPGQNVWCRQLNSERKEGTKCRNEGGNLWILGMRAEHLGTVLELTGGGHTEVNGLFLYSNAGWNEEDPAFVIRDSSAVFLGINERNFNRSPVSFWVSETQGEETKELREKPFIFLSQ